MVTNLAVMGFHPESKRMRVESLHPGVTRNDLLAETGFELMWANKIDQSSPPTDEELHILRYEVDPHRYVIGRVF